MDWNKGKDSGLMKLVMTAKMDPARPVKTADRVKAMARMSTGLSPSDCPATSESRTARMAMPHGLAARRANRNTEITASAATKSAMSRSANVYPKASGTGMFIIPFQPPVSSFHSAAPCSTTKPKAMVTMAR